MPPDRIDYELLEKALQNPLKTKVAYSKQHIKQVWQLTNREKEKTIVQNHCYNDAEITALYKKCALIVLKKTSKRLEL